MSQTTDTLQNWFDSLTTQQKREVVEFLYGPNRPDFDRATGSVKAGSSRGLFLGPAPSGPAGVCGGCGRPF
jgi:hypothetical protein